MNDKHPTVLIALKLAEELRKLEETVAELECLARYAIPPLPSDEDSNDSE